jgi:uncharacterized protein (DUF1499 family)
MGWFTNVAEFEYTASCSPADAYAAYKRAWEVLANRRWKLTKSDDTAHSLEGTCTTRIFRFVDDVRVRVEPHAQGCKIHARSASRVGKGDMFKNKKNLEELEKEAALPNVVDKTVLRQ